MRRLSFLLVLLAATAAFAAEPNLRFVERDFAERSRHMILSPQRPLTGADRAELREKGVDVQRPLSGGRYVARVIDVARATADSRVASVEPLTNDDKILRSALRAARGGKTWADLAVFFHEDVSFDDARNAVLAAGGSIDDLFATTFGPMQRMEVRVAPAALSALAADDRVLAISGRPRAKLLEQNQKSGEISSVNLLHAAPYNLTGEGQTVMVSELSEAEHSHPEFQGRMVTAGGVGNKFHSTHVSGTVGAAGLDPRAKGMAPKVQIREFNIGSSVSSLLNLFKQQFPLIKPIANNVSLGFALGWCDQCGGSKTVWNDEEEYFGAYEPGYGTPALDDLAIEHGTLMVFASGNYADYPFLDALGSHLHNNDKGDPDETKTYCFTRNATGTDCPTDVCQVCETDKHLGILPFDTMSVTGTAKNVIAVGAVHTLTVTPDITGFSSRGPAKDGRIKPELVARGQGVYSTAPNGQYANSQGTSMAAPAVAGMIALLGEQWAKTFGAGVRPTAAELKGLMLISAKDLGNPGPDYTYGFGLADAKNAVDIIIADGGTRSQIKNISVAAGSRIETTITLPAQQTLKVLAQWSDPSVILLGKDSYQAKALVNDVDLTVVGPNGTTHFPWKLDKANHLANATRGVNSIDNTELVEIPNAAPGVYRAFLNGTQITAGPQNVVLIANAKGVTSIPCADNIEPNDTPDQAYGNVLSAQTVSGAICAASDVDFIKFLVSRFGPVQATITTGDTPIRATLTSSAGTASVDVPANSTRTVQFQYGSGSAQSPDLQVMLKLEAAGTIGSNPRWDATLSFGQFAGPRRRAVR